MFTITHAENCPNKLCENAHHVLCDSLLNTALRRLFCVGIYVIVGNETLNGCEPESGLLKVKTQTLNTFRKVTCEVDGFDGNIYSLWTSTIHLTGYLYLVHVFASKALVFLHGLAGNYRFWHSNLIGSNI